MAYDENGAAVCVVCYAISTSMGSVVAKLDDVSVKGDRRGHGTGSEMLEQLKEQLRKEAVTRIDVAVHLENPQARLRRPQRRAPFLFDLIIRVAFIIRGSVCDLLEILRKRDHPARSLLPIEILIRRVIAVLRKRQAEEQHRTLHNLFDTGHRTDRPAIAHENGILAKSELHSSF